MSLSRLLVIYSNLPKPCMGYSKKLIVRDAAHCQKTLMLCLAQAFVNVDFL